MSQAYTTSLVIRFGEGTTAVDFSAELDTREDGYNNGRTTFRASAPGVPGDDAYILVFLKSGYTIEAFSSAGSIAYQQDENIQYTEVVVFTDGEATLSRPSNQINSRTWLGVNGGTITVEGKALRANPSVKVAVARITYTATARVYYLTPPTKTQMGEDGQVAVLMVATQ